MCSCQHARADRATTETAADESVRINLFTRRKCQHVKAITGGHLVVLMTAVTLPGVSCGRILEFWAHDKDKSAARRISNTDRPPSSFLASYFFKLLFVQIYTAVLVTAIHLTVTFTSTVNIIIYSDDHNGNNIGDSSISLFL